MGIFTQTPEQKAEKERKRLAEEQRRLAAEFAATPVGQARKARSSGMTIFQIDLPLSKTKGATVAMVGAFASTDKTSNYAGLIQAIEHEGWRLEHVGYVYRITGSESRDKFMASGQQEAVSGEIVGIYIFRASDSHDGAATPTPATSPPTEMRLE